MKLGVPPSSTTIVDACTPRASAAQGDNTLAKIKNIKMPFIDFDICHQKMSLRKLYSVNVTYFLEIKNVTIVKSLKRNELAKKGFYRF